MHLCISFDSFDIIIYRKFQASLLFIKWNERKFRLKTDAQIDKENFLIYVKLIYGSIDFERDQNKKTMYKNTESVCMCWKFV